MPLAATVVPDLSGLRREFDYEVPASIAATLRIGDVVRVELRSRRVRAWVVALAREAPAAAGVLKPLISVASAGPPSEVVDLARWASFRYAGDLRPFLLAGTPPRLVPPHLVAPRPAAPRPAAPQPPRGAHAAVRHAPAARSPVPHEQVPGPRAPTARATSVNDAVAAAIGNGGGLVRLPPAYPRAEVLDALLEQLGGPNGLLVLAAERREAELLRRRAERRHVPVALLPDEWPAAAGGARLVLGARAAAFAPLAELRAALVFDAHDEAYTETRAPSWSAPVVLAERTRRAGVPLVLVSACPGPELVELAVPVLLERGLERSGWPVVEVIDRRGEDPRSGRYSPRLAPLIHGARAAQPELPVVCVINRTGHVRLLACAACGELARCEACGAAVHAEAAAGSPGAAGTLACPSCGVERPSLCACCGAGRLRRLRVGAAGAAHELAALTGLPAREVSAAGRATPAGAPGAAQPAEPAAGELLVGTEAVLRRVRAASLVVFLDLDQELLAPRLRAAEQALALLALAGRLVGGRDAAGRGGRLAVQTRLAAHDVVRSAVHGDPGLLEAAERERRHALSLPPFSALALLSGAGAAELAARLRTAGLAVGDAPGQRRGSLLVRAPSSSALASALEAAAAREVDVRVEVDPIRL